MPQSHIPPSLHVLFWDVDPAAIRLPEHADYVLERIMQRGTWESMLWLRRSFPVADIAEFLARKQHRLAPRERAYWQLIAGACDEPQVPGGGRPPWAGP